ncbi:MAG TPA: LysR substrate-binding domain-containing protein [Kofleriaceae bacterium]|nr:LysR substrate-binding domain-containing protein [Kofleriaceae bacterium]
MTRKSQPARRLDFDELAAAEVFLQVVKANGFTPAAKALGKSTSSLSRTLAELERQLGAQLLARTTRRLHLTEAGALYATHAEALLAAQRAARDAVAELTGGVPRGHLRVSMPVSVGERLLGPAIPELHRRFPELRLELDLSDRNVPLVQGGFDLAIRVGRLADSSLRAQLLGKLGVRLVASPRYVASHGNPAHPDKLRDHACILLGPLAGAHEWQFHRRGARPKRIDVHGVVHTTSPTLAAQLAASGLGIARIVDWVIREELRRGELVDVMPGWSCDDPAIGGLPVYAVFAQSAGMPLPLKTRVFIDAVKELISGDVFRRAASK